MAGNEWVLKYTQCLWLRGGGHSGVATLVPLNPLLCCVGSGEVEERGRERENTWVSSSHYKGTIPIMGPHPNALIQT